MGVQDNMQEIDGADTILFLKFKLDDKMKSFNSMKASYVGKKITQIMHQTKWNMHLLPSQIQNMKSNLSHDKQMQCQVLKKNQDIMMVLFLSFQNTTNVI